LTVRFQTKLIYKSGVVSHAASPLSGFASPGLFILLDYPPFSAGNADYSAT
jgi:hypothetical protein